MVESKLFCSLAIGASLHLLGTFPGTFVWDFLHHFIGNGANFSDINNCTKWVTLESVVIIFYIKFIVDNLHIFIIK